MGLIAEGTHQAQPCPECQQGKHGNCTLQVPDDLLFDSWVDCPCNTAGHTTPTPVEYDHDVEHYANVHADALVQHHQATQAAINAQDAADRAADAADKAKTAEREAYHALRKAEREYTNALLRDTDGRHVQR